MGLALRKYMVLFYTCTYFKENISTQSGNLETISHVFGHKSPLHAEKLNNQNLTKSQALNGFLSRAWEKYHKNAKLPIYSH